MSNTKTILTTTTNSPSGGVPVGNPQTAYSIKAGDLVNVDLTGLTNLQDTDDTKTLVGKLKLVAAKVSGNCYRLNIILQQINARIASIATKVSTSIPYTARIILAGAQTTGTDVLANRYRLTMQNSVTFNSYSITAKVAPSTGPLVITILRSQNGGITWISVGGVITLQAGATVTAGFFSGGLSIGDLVRVDVTSGDGVVSGVEVVLAGYVNQ